MHTITLTLTGVINDSGTVTLDDPAAFALFMTLKQYLGADSTPVRRRIRRSATTPGTDDAPVAPEPVDD